jgi:translation initiation factor 2-alpha kinase 4
VLDYTYDSADAYIDESQAWTRVVKNRLSQLFERHGAIELSTPLLAPALLSMDLDQNSSARLLDSQGNLASDKSSHPLES